MSAARIARRRGCVGALLLQAGLALAAESPVLALREGWIPASVGFAARDEAIPFAPLTEATPVVRRYAVSTSLAFGGNNAAFVAARTGGPR